MGKKKNKHINIPNSPKKEYIHASVANTEDMEKTGNDKKVFISIKHIQHSYQCFSAWEKTEMSKFWAFSKKLHDMTWQQVYATASKGQGKRGLAYTTIPKNNYNNEFVNKLSEDIDMFELRVDGAMRVHGYRDKAIFNLCFLDREHKITK